MSHEQPHKGIWHHTLTQNLRFMGLLLTYMVLNFSTSTRCGTSPHTPTRLTLHSALGKSIYWVPQLKLNCDASVNNNGATSCVRVMRDSHGKVLFSFTTNLDELCALFIGSNIAVSKDLSNFLLRSDSKLAI